MKIAIRAAMAALSLASIGSANASESEGSLLTSIPGVVASAPVQQAPGVTAARGGRVVHT
jgi:hypothetical protein